MNQFTISIDNKITEQVFVEYCLNLKASGYDPLLFFIFYGLGKSWNVNGLFYYLKLMRELE